MQIRIKIAVLAGNIKNTSNINSIGTAYLLNKGTDVGKLRII